ncbi:MAG: 1-acyl-sn-glycerol-3-phosphate acyltransferase [Actinobacteria bacterium]|nr:1-acyl-sn-glycerol-3-phosphate acyltransferase [Actinomycetota bacterium]
MNYGDFAWRTSRLWLAPAAVVLTRGRGYGLDRIPANGGCVLAVTHLAWIDIPLVGALSPRNINYVAKVELERVPLFGSYLEWHGIIPIRRGESDRDAVRAMRQAARDGRAVGVFVEGTRQRHTGVPGEAKPGAAMVALQESVPVVPIAVYGTYEWRPWNFNPCSLAVGQPVRYDDLPKNGKGYKEATADIERRIRELYDWLADVHARGRPRDETPPL